MADKSSTSGKGRTLGQPECWTRLEFSEHRFVANAAAHTDGVVIPLRFDTAVPADADLGPVPSSKLKPQALASRMPFLIDLESWRLPYLTGHNDHSLRRDAASLLASAVALPLSPDSLAQESELLPLVRAAMTAQVGATYVFAPDFQFSTVDDKWVGINLRSIALTRSLAGAHPVGAWIHVTFQTMVSGVLPYLAERYAQALPAGATMVITVSDMHPTVGPEDLATYLHALSAFEAVGLRVLVDRAGDASIPAVATHASGCMLGTRIYRTAAPTPHFESDFNPKVRLAYYVGSQGRRVRRDVARARHAAGRLPECQHTGCNVVNAEGKKANLLLRLHSAHELRDAVVHARRVGLPALLTEWREAKLQHLRYWAQAIEEVNARSEEA